MVDFYELLLQDEHLKGMFENWGYDDKIIVSNYGVREDVDLIKFYLEEIKYKKGDKIILYLPEICINSNYLLYLCI